MASDPYASHIPLLSKLGANVTSVLELGCGMYSTPLFLNRDVYPKLTRLVTVEPDRKWAMYPEPDPRLTIVITAMPMYEVLSDLLVVPFDLVFVDNSPAEEREEAIRYLAGTGGLRAVIHDFEEQRYQAAAAPFWHKEVDTSVIPHTALVWND